MKSVYIIHAKRTPIGKLAGALSGVRVDDLLAIPFADFKKSATFDLTEIDDVIAGCANQAGEDNRNVARMASVLAGFPYEVPAATTNRLCGSSLDATINAFTKIAAGFAHCIVVGGVEGMSRAPYVLSKAESPFSADQKIYNTALGWRFPNPAMEKIFPLLSMGETAEEVAKANNISRKEQDQFAYESQKKAVAAQSSGAFTDEIIPVATKTSTVDKDEGPRTDTTLEKLATLKPVFKKDGSVTAGNSSTLNDGSSMVVLVSEEFLKRHNLKPLARISGFGVRGIHPNIMGLGPVESTKTLMKNFGKKISDFHHIELNEAFAAQAIGCIKGLDIDPKVVNQNGGAIALGHPLGCSGTRILTTLIYRLQKDVRAKEGLATMCIGVGQGISLSIEKA